MPTGGVQAPATFPGSLASTGNIFKGIGGAAASVTGPADDAVTPLINNDVFLVVPRAFHALDVAVVEAFNVGGAVLTPGDFIQAVQTGRTNILGALNQPGGPADDPDGPPRTGPRRRRAATGAVRRSRCRAAAGATRAGQVISSASAPVAAGVNTAVTDIGNALHDPFPAGVRKPKREKGFGPNNRHEPVQCEVRRLRASGEA
jgi:hypothetical protein